MRICLYLIRLENGYSHILKVLNRPCVVSVSVADYRPAKTSAEKVKKTEGALSIPLTRTDDILQYLGEHKKNGQFLCGFSMETEHLLEHSRSKLERKHLDMIVANNLKVTGAGFGTDTNIVTLITADSATNLPIMSKDEVARCLTDTILKHYQRGSRP